MLLHAAVVRQATVAVALGGVGADVACLEACYVPGNVLKW